MHALIKLDNITMEGRMCGHLFLTNYNCGTYEPNIYQQFDITMVNGTVIKLIGLLSKYQDTHNPGECYFTKTFNQIISEKMDIYVSVIGVVTRYSFDDIKHLLIRPIYSRFRDNAFFNYDGSRDLEADLSQEFDMERLDEVPEIYVAQKMEQYGWIWAAFDDNEKIHTLRNKMRKLLNLRHIVDLTLLADRLLDFMTDHQIKTLIDESHGDYDEALVK